MDFIVRELEERDFEHGFFETVSNLSPLDGLTPQKAKEALKKLTAQGGRVFVALTAQGEVIGTTSLLIEQKFIHDGGLVGHIEDVATKKGHEGKGIGKSVMQAAIAYAWNQGCYKIILDCSEHNVPFYEKQGFHTHEVCMRIDKPSQR